MFLMDAARHRWANAHFCHTAQQLHSVIHRSTTAVTVPVEASGDQPIETGPGVTTGPHPSVWGTRHRL